MEKVKDTEKSKKMGRPQTAQYRKIKHRMSRIEDTFREVLEVMKDKEDKALVEQALEKLKNQG